MANTTDGDDRGQPDAAAPGTTTPHVAGWIERRVSHPGESEESRRRKVQFAIATVLVVPAGLIWGALYFAYGEHAFAAIPVSYSLLTVLDILIVLRLRRYELFRHIQQLLILMLPFALQIALGGFVGSSAVILWSLLAVLTAVLFGSAGEALGWFAAYVAAVIGAALLRPHLVIENRLPEPLVLTFFVLNIVTVSALTFVVLFSFVTDRRRLRELEVAFLNREVMLRQSEKLATLGTLAAGVAHELNNPAAATRRAAEQLREAFGRLERAHLELDALVRSSDALDVVHALEGRIREHAGRRSDLDPLARSDREADIEDWLADHDVADPADLAPALVAMGFDASELAPVAGALSPEATGAVLAWASCAFQVHTLLTEIHHGSSRISDIVGALKTYSYVGKAPVQNVDIHEGLESTLVMMRGKLTGGVTVRRDYGTDVPVVQAYGSELNQMWTNLIDNAADAMNGSGEIVIRTRDENGWAVVEIEDNGPGIPTAIQSCIFDPFFTTKPPGKGTGLGLATTHSIVTEQHRGRIAVESRPGMTRFTVKLPSAAAR